MPRGPRLVFILACLGLALGIALATVLVLQGRSAPAPGVTSTGQATVGGPFTLVDQDGQTRNETMLDGRWSVVFFGFTHCPDYCPTTLQMLNATRTALGPQGRDLQIVFVSVDPERDTPTALKDYLATASFPDGVIGLTGTPEQVAAAARAYRAFYERSGEGDAYLMNHSLTLYLMGPDGRFRRPLSHDIGPERAADVIRGAMAEG